MISSYLKYPVNTDINKDKYVFRPFVSVEFVNVENGRIFVIDCLIDTGADYCFAPLDVAVSLGLELKKSKKMPIIGIGGQKVLAFFLPVRIRIGGEKIDTEIGFGDFDIPLLGQYGFFNKVGSVSFHYPKFFKINF